MTPQEKEGEVAILGLGKSGASAAKLLLADGKRVYVSDSYSAPQVEDIARQLRDIGASVDTGGHDLARIARAQLIKHFARPVGRIVVHYNNGQIRHKLQQFAY